LVSVGDVALVKFPFSATEDPPFKQRPVLVLAVVGVPPDQAILCAMITENERRVRRLGPGDALVSDWAGSGLAKPSVVRTRRIWSAEERDVAKVIGRCGAALVADVRTELARLLGL
jgi:mRNA-degrading endonuclease toxin of MazEF toxin-antitoxin module